MASHIPTALNDAINEDPFYRQCCITGRTYGKIDRHHNLIFAGKQVQAKWAILPLAKSVHDKASHPEVKDRCDWVMLSRATYNQLLPYSKAIDYVGRLGKLEARFGIWAPGILPPPIPAGIVDL